VWEKHVVPHGPLVPLAGNLWQVTGRVEPKSDAVMRNMVVYRLPRSNATQDDSTEPPAVASISAAGSTATEPKEESREELLLHSVIALSDEGMQELDNLGRVKYILVPSPFHRLDAAVYKQRYPDAQVICPKSIRKQVSKVVPVDAVVEDVFGHDYASQGLKCYTPGAGLYIPELVYELPLKEEKDSTQEMATESDKKALVFCDLVTNVTEGPLNVRILGIVTGGNNPIVPWMPRYFFVRDKAQTKRFLETLGRRDDIGLLVMAHGEPVKCGPDEMKRHLANLAAQF
jgi:hypothetical protein